MSEAKQTISPYLVVEDDDCYDSEYKKIYGPIIDYYKIHGNIRPATPVPFTVK